MRAGVRTGPFSLVVFHAMANEQKNLLTLQVSRFDAIKRRLRQNYTKPQSNAYVVGCVVGSSAY